MTRALRRFLIPVLLILSSLTLSFHAVYAAENSVSVILEINNLLEGDTPPSQTSFRFALTALDGAPLPNGAEGAETIASCNGAGILSFDKIVFTQVGDYRYEIHQTTEPATGYTYDSSVYVATIQVSWKSEDSDDLQALVAIEKKNEHRKANHIHYTNRYSADVAAEGDNGGGTNASGGENGSGSVLGMDGGRPQTGDSSQLSFWLSICGLSLAALIALIVGAAAEKKKSSGS